MKDTLTTFVHEHLMMHTVLISVAASAILGAMVIDFVFGIHKAKQRGEARTSTGYKKTASKAQKYFSPFLVLVFIDLIGCAVIPFPVFSMLWAAYCVFCEFKSVREKSWQKEELRKAERTMNVILENKDDIAKRQHRFYLKHQKKRRKRRMNKIDAIVVHCSATKAGQDIGKKEITQMHLQRGFSTIGYNYIIRLDGTIEVGRSLTIEGAHCNSKGFSGVSYNKHSIGICYVGGLDKSGKAADTRTSAQKKALRELIAKLIKQYPDIKEILGHRDTSPDLDGDGIVESNEWIKMCPCFDVQKEYSDLLVA